MFLYHFVKVFITGKVNLILCCVILILLSVLTMSRIKSNKAIINEKKLIKSHHKLTHLSNQLESYDIQEDTNEMTNLITTTLQLQAERNSANNEQNNLSLEQDFITATSHLQADDNIASTEKNNLSLVHNIPQTYKVTQVDAEEMADAIRDFLRGQSTDYGSLKLTAEENLLEFFKHLDEKNIAIDLNAFNKKRKRILILTSYHSGSTFAGNLFDVNPDVFYMFEPLQIILFRSGWGKPRIRQNETNYHLNKMLKCEFVSTIKASIKYYPDDDRERWFKRCFKDKPEKMQYTDETIDTVANALEAHCANNFTTTVIKTIRADSIASIVPLLASGVKILYLARDPRGLANSRFKKKLDTAQDRLVEHMAMECSKNHRNIEFLRKAQEIKSLHNLLMRNFRIIRYEDIAYSTMERCRDIFHFVGLKMTEEVRNWIILNTSFNTTLDVEDTETLSDRSKAIASKWRLTLPYEVIRTLEDSCKLTMDELGFKVLKSKKEYADESIDLIDELKNIPYTF